MFFTSPNNVPAMGQCFVFQVHVLFCFFVFGCQYQCNRLNSVTMEGYLQNNTEMNTDVSEYSTKRYSAFSGPH